MDNSKSKIEFIPIPDEVTKLGNKEAGDTLAQFMETIEGIKPEQQVEALKSLYIGSHLGRVQNVWLIKNRLNTKITELTNDRDNWKKTAEKHQIKGK